MQTTFKWKGIVFAILAMIGFIYALPNGFRPDPSIQISGQSGGQVISENALNQATKALEAANIPYKAIERAKHAALIRFSRLDDQLRAKQVVDSVLQRDYVIALNLASTTPTWLTNLGANPMKLGLDLSGGVHFLLEVDTDFSINKQLDGYYSDIRKTLRENKIRGRIIQDKTTITGQFSDRDTADQAIRAVRNGFNLTALTTPDGEGVGVTWSLPEPEQKRMANEAVEQNLMALRNRVNQLGVSEPLVQRQGAKRIVVQLPGVQDASAAKRIIGKTANLEFRLESNGRGLKETFAFKDQSSRRGTAALESRVIVTGENVATANTSFDENGGPQVNITLDGDGGRRMHEATKRNVGRSLGVLFIERKNKLSTRLENGVETINKTPYYEKEIISLATIQAALGVQFRVTGLNSIHEAKELALLLRAGALAAPVDFVEERTIGPSLGADNVALGLKSVMAGFVLVLIFMIVFYRVFGIAANIALLINLVLLVAVMSVLSATLTLPGIAGIVLTVGMAVDANVLIFERIREEMRAEGTALHEAIHTGFDRAFVTIMDANITTLLVAIILYSIGSGPIKGFAVTLSIGIITSMLTAIVGTRGLLELMYRNKKQNYLS